MTIEGQGSLAERLAGVEEIECVTPTSTGCRAASDDRRGLPQRPAPAARPWRAAMHHGRLPAGALLWQRRWRPGAGRRADPGPSPALEQHSARLRHLRCAGTGWLAVRAVHARPAQAGGGALRRPRLATGGGHRTGILRLRPEHRSQRAVPGPAGDGRRELGYSAFSVSSNNGLRPFFEDVYRCMDALGLVRDTFMHEMGTSQFEINFLHGDPVLLADQTFLFKHLLKEVALKHGLIVVHGRRWRRRRAARCTSTRASSNWTAGETSSAKPTASLPPRSATSSAASRLPGGLHALLRAACELLPAPLPSLRFAEQRLLVPRQPRRRPAHPGQRTVRAARRESPAGRRRQPIPGHRRQPGRRLSTAWSTNWSRARRSRASSRYRRS